jgi:hypothetical protein
MHGDAYTLNAPQFACQTCINLYASGKQDEHLAKYPAVYFRVPGREVVTTISGASTAEGRWIGSFAGRLFCIIGDGLYEYDTDLDSTTARGTLSTATGNVTVIYNGTDFQIFDGVASKVFNLAANTLTAVTDPDFDQATQACYIDGYGLSVVPNSNVVQVSELNTFTDYVITRRKSFSATGGNIVTIAANSLDIWVIGETSTEIWRNDGGNLDIADSTPLSRLPGSSLDYGCAAPFSLQQIDNKIIWLTRKAQGANEVVLISGHSPEIVSTEAMHQRWSAYDTVSDATSWSYTHDGHTFYVLTFPSANETWVYDLSADLWHQMADWSNSLGFVRTGIVDYCYHTNNIPYVVTYNTKNISRLSGSVYTNDGDTVVLERTLATVTDGQKLTSYHQFQIDLEKGRGLTTGQGENPQIMLSISRDGGRTWGAEQWQSMGKIGQYKPTVCWKRLGTNRNFTPRLRISDPVPVTLFNAVAIVEKQDLD